MATGTAAAAKRELSKNERLLSAYTLMADIAIRILEQQQKDASLKEVKA